MLIVTWLVTLILGRLPRPFHRFFSAYLRYQTHVNAYVLLVSNLFPGFTGKAGSYPVDLELPTEPERHNRWGVFFRGLLAFPAAFLAWSLSGAAVLAVCGAWFVSLILGRMPRGLRDLIAYSLRYSCQLSAYLVYFLTSRYPNSSPYVGTVLPDFAAPSGVYHVGLELPVEPERQNRWGVFFRGLLAFPAGVLSYQLSIIRGLLAIAGWFATLIRGRMPRGVRDLSAYCLRYQIETNAYRSLVAKRYPNASPDVGMSPVTAEAPAAPPEA
jgi:hypothetical protein